MSKKNKKNNKIYKIIPIFAVLLIVCIIITMLFAKKEDKEPVPYDETAVNNLVHNVFFNNKKTVDEINGAVGGGLIKSDVFIGKDGLLGYKPDSNKIKNLNNYVKRQDVEKEKVEKKYLDNTTYETYKDGENVIFEIKAWNFATYSEDLYALELELIKLDGYDINTFINYYSDENEIIEYKARVKAMTIINDYLDFYNSQDMRKMTFIIENGKAYPGDLFSLYMNFNGFTSNFYKENSNTNNERVNRYIKDAIASNELDPKNPLAID